MLAIIHLWPTQDSPMHPLVLQCTLKQDRHLISPHTEVDDKIEWAHSQFNHLLPLILLRLEDLRVVAYMNTQPFGWHVNIPTIPLKKSPINKNTCNYGPIPLPWPLRRPLQEPEPRLWSQEPSWP